MAAKPVAAGNKRKAMPSGPNAKGRSDSKKARIEEPKARKPAPASKGDASTSDSEDGGVSLDDTNAKNANTKADAGANAESFDRSKLLERPFPFFHFLHFVPMLTSHAL